MTVSATLAGVFLKGVAASRPAANAVAGGTVYSATDTGVITQSDGSSWSTWATISSGMANPMTTQGDIIYGGSAGAPTRLAAVATGKFLGSQGTSTAPAWISPLAGVSYLGYNTVGGSFANMNGAYAKKITMANDGLILSISAHVKGDAGSHAFGFGAGLLTDNAGAPANHIANSGGTMDSNVIVTLAAVLGTSARWVSVPLNAYVTAGDYWIVIENASNNAGTQLAFDGSGSDYTKAGVYLGDHSAQAFSSGSNKYSIRALVLY